MENKNGNLISIVGAGGKTSLLLYFGEMLKNRGKPVVITTTTHMYKPDGSWYRESQIEEIKEKLRKGELVWAGEPAGDDKKIRGFSEEAFKELCAAAFEAGAWVLAEADGAKHFPCKMPAEHEPVIPDETTVVIGVAGLDCLGRSLREGCFRAELAAELLKTDTDHIMTEENLASILISPEGTKKGIPSQAEYVIILNKSDLPGAYEKGMRVREILREKGFPGRVLIKGGYGNEGIN